MKSAVFLIAAQEFTLNLRNKWVYSFSALFALLTFFISYFGMVTSGYAGFQDFARTSTSLINIAGFVIPLFALLLGVFSFISNNEYMELLVTQPAPRSHFILGKYLGLIFTIVSATLIGFCIPGVIISLTIGLAGALGYALVILYAALMGVIFTGGAVLISQIAGRQQIAIGIAIGVWIFYQVVYGILVLGITLYFPAKVMKSFLVFSLLGSPVDIIRVLSLIAVGGPEFFGPAGATLLKLTGAEWLAVLFGLVGLLVWIVWPLMLSLRIFSRQNL